MKKNLALATLLSLLSISCQPGYGRQSYDRQSDYRQPTNTASNLVSTMLQTQQMTDDADAEIVRENREKKGLWEYTKSWGRWITSYGSDYSIQSLDQLEREYRKSPSAKLADAIAKRKEEIKYMLSKEKKKIGQGLVGNIIDKHGNRIEEGATKIGGGLIDKGVDLATKVTLDQADDSATPTDQVAEIITDTKRLSNISKREIKNALLAELGDDFNITQLPTKQQLKNVEQAALGQIQEWYTERQTVASLTKRIKDLINQNITAILTRAPAKGKSYDEHALDQIDKLNTALNLQN